MTEEEKAELERLQALKDEEEEEEEDTSEEEDPPERVPVSPKTLDKKDQAIKAERRKNRELKAQLAGQSDPATIAETVRQSLQADERKKEQLKACIKIASNDGEKDAMMTYLETAPSVGDYDTDAELALIYVKRKAEINKGVSSPNIPAGGEGEPKKVPRGVTEGQVKLAEQQGLSQEDLEKYGGEIKL